MATTASNNGNDNFNHHDNAFSRGDRDYDDDKDDDNLLLVQRTAKERNPNVSLKSASKRRAPSSKKGGNGNAKKAMITPTFMNARSTMNPHVVPTRNSQDMQSISSSTSADLKAGKESFPCKLYRILSNPEEFSQYITWLPHGHSWKVLDQKLFEEVVIPRYFRHKKFSSFMRQVTGWGFKRVTKGPDRNSYYHKLFVRDMPHLCAKMERPPNPYYGIVDPTKNHHIAEDADLLYHQRSQQRPRSGDVQQSTNTAANSANSAAGLTGAGGHSSSFNNTTLANQTALLRGCPEQQVLLVGVGVPAAAPTISDHVNAGRMATSISMLQQRRQELIRQINEIDAQQANHITSSLSPPLMNAPGHSPLLLTTSGNALGGMGVVTPYQQLTALDTRIAQSQSRLNNFVGNGINMLGIGASVVESVNVPGTTYLPVSSNNQFGSQNLFFGTTTSPQSRSQY